MKVKTFVSVFFIFLCSLTVKAQNANLNTVSTAVPFLLETADTKASGMGIVGGATLPTANAIFWNTSKLAFTDKKISISAGYAPLFRQVIKNVNLLNLNGYYHFSDKFVFTAGLKYFNYGKVILSNYQGEKQNEITPNEFSITSGTSFKINDRSALGLNAKFVFSSLTGGGNSGAITTKNGLAGAVDLSYSWFKNDLTILNKKSIFSYGVCVSNLGNKMSYSSNDLRFFLPSNLRLGTALKMILNESNVITTAIDINKLLVPSTPIYNSSNEIISGISNDVGVISGVLHSFYDAPGVVNVDSLGNVDIKKGSRFKEEINEISFGVGFEYFYNKTIAFRTGYYNESNSKGGRKFLTFGFGLSYNRFGLNFSYLTSVSKFNNLGNSFRISLNYHILKKDKE